MATANLPPTYALPAPPRKDWFNRNWKWFVPLLVACALAMVVGFIAVIVSFALTMVKQSYPYQYAIRSAEQSPEVSQRLGEPLKLGWFVSGQINYSDQNGDAVFEIPVSGPKGRGTIDVQAEKRNGQWQFQTLELDIDGSSSPVYLLQGQPPPSGGPSPGTT
ncbi:MAG TPA: cytochrome c oxidase assembly factor Coa1 family protein [Verrucomicrobiae bacterium]|nr:cytochrome c oxidase assembly factor Coa1 family protein [Verrucomicrobiae bacterium]